MMNAATAPRSRWSLAALAGVLLLALALRLWGLDWGLPNGERRAVSYHPDENTYLHRIATANPAGGDFIIDLRGQALVNYTLAGLMFGADVVGWFDLVPSEDYYITHPEQAARMYLLGRFISVVTGLLTVLLLYLIVRKSWPGAPWWLAPLGTLFLGVAPGHVINCHYLETDVPVTFFITLTVYWLIDVAQRGRWRDYMLAGASAGLAIGTKWSALPLLPVLLVAHGLGQPAWWRPGTWLGRAQLGRLLVLGVALLATFFLTNPYVLLHPTASAGGAAELGGSLFGNVGPGAFVAGLAQLFADTLPASLGWGLYLLGGTGLIAALLHRRRTPVETLALVWIGLFGMVAAVTYNATVGRTLPLAPFFILLAVAAVDRARRWVACSRPRGAALAAAVALAVALALGPSLVAGLFFYCSDTASQDASRWIQANVPAGSTFGLYNQDPYWDDPDLLYEDFFHPPAGGSRYRYVVYPLDAANPPYPDVEYLIWTQRDARKVGELLTPEQAAALTRWMDERYEPVADFESVVRVLGLEFRDLHQTFITSHIHVLKLK